MKLMNMTSVMTMSSLEIAELTGKRHDNVLADIRNMLAELAIEATEFSGALKMPSGQKSKVYKLPKRECLVLVSGYSIVLRTKIIDRWLELEAAEAARSTAKAMDAENRAALRMEYRPMTDALKSVREDTGKETKAYHYSNEADMINRIVTGYPAKKFKSVHEMPESNLRDLLTPIQKQAMLSLQKANTVYLEEGLSFEERKERLNTLFNRRWNAKLIEECHLMCE